MLEKTNDKTSRFPIKDPVEADKFVKSIVNFLQINLTDSQFQTAYDTYQELSQDKTKTNQIEFVMTKDLNQRLSEIDDNKNLLDRLTGKERALALHQQINAFALGQLKAKEFSDSYMDSATNLTYIEGLKNPFPLNESDAKSIATYVISLEKAKNDNAIAEITEKFTGLKWITDLEEEISNIFDDYKAGLEDDNEIKAYVKGLVSGLKFMTALHDYLVDQVSVEQLEESAAE